MLLLSQNWNVGSDWLAIHNTCWTISHFSGGWEMVWLDWLNPDPNFSLFGGSGSGYDLCTSPVPRPFPPPVECWRRERPAWQGSAACSFDSPCVHMVAYARQPLSSSMTAELSYIQLKAANEARVSVSASREKLWFHVGAQRSAIWCSGRMPWRSH